MRPDHAITRGVRGGARFAAALTLILGAACSAPSQGSSAAERSLVRATTSPAETVGIEKADLYRSKEIAGVIEQRPERAIRAAWTGTFTRAPGIRRGTAVRRGALMGTVRTCEAPVGSAPLDSGGTAPDATGSSDTATVPSRSTPGAGVGTDPDPTTPACRPRWHAVRAPVAGTITALADEDVTQGANVATVRPPGYVIKATVTDPATVYALMKPPPTGKTRILGGPAGFTVRFEHRTYEPSDGSVVFVLAVPLDVRVVEGLRTSTAFVVSRRSAVPTLPVTAVQGTTGVGQVVVVDRGRNVVTSVKLGQYDGARVEVTGLPEGARVLRFPLASDFLAAP